MKQTFKHLMMALVALFVLSGCGGINALIKEGDPNEIYAKALEFYKNGKWNRAATLFESVASVYLGTEREDSIAFYHAHCKYKGSDYDTASQLLDEFRRRFGRSVFIEDAEGMYADCFYRMSPGPSRDQTMTSKAIIAINEFISRYPESDKVEDFQKINDELTQRLHDKTYLNAYTYYKIGRYKSAIVALKNALRTYPESNHREEIMFLIVDSSYRLAENSIASKQTDRYLTMLDSYLSFCEEFPESKHRKTVDRHAEKARDYLDRNNAGQETQAN
ncbi:MAG: outer membrane protein assembly factor BamD [Rikenellaceae bacterium]|nr:outer membrane protein assembly factor BamD [Rikenellaceae bacterium]